jgi:Ca-activated chloride channel family protein
MRIRTTVIAIALSVSALVAGSAATGSADRVMDDAQGKNPPPKTQNPPPKTQKPATPDDPAQDKDQPPLRIGTDLVTLDVTVIDAGGGNKPVMDLKQEQFQVFEDKTAQEIRFFSREQVPVSVVFTIDTSGSMKAKLDTVIKASINLVKEGRAADEMSVIEFKETPELLSEFTEDVHEITDTLQNLTGSGRTAMLDALYLAADYAHKEAKNRRRAVVLVTDGLDRNSYYKFEEIIDRLRETDVQIYLIGFTNDLSSDGAWVFKKSDKDKAEGLLNRIATETGGRAFFPKELSEVHTIAQQISTDLRTQYSIGYYPSNANRDGTFRAIRVNVTGGGNRRLVARTRTGYTATREGEQPKPAKQSSPN